MAHIIRGEPLQLIQLNPNVDKGGVQVDQDSLGRLEKNLKALGTKQVAVVSVMGAFRTGKSFLLDLMLRFLRYEEACRKAGMEPHPPVEIPERGKTENPSEDFRLPAWFTEAGETIEGSTDGPSSGGFRFKGGMDACTEGIWVWSEPFVRTINGQEVALILVDTQGAWDSQLTKEQSATIFGLTAVLSSKQVYNISMQIQEDKVENLAYFMRFAQAALRQAPGTESNSNKQIDNSKAFQSLDFLVRDWRNFEDNFTVKQCRDQMDEHLARHMDPKRVKENSTAEALQQMFTRISCFCLPHPGRKIEKEQWTGKLADVDKDFVRLMDQYMKEVFTIGLDTKTILGAELSTVTFPMVLNDFVNAFRDAAPVAMTFNQAMQNCTVLIAKEKAMKTYQQKMDEYAKDHPGGIEAAKFESFENEIRKAIKEEYEKTMIFGAEEIRGETWSSIMDSLKRLSTVYLEDNQRRLEKALVSFANFALLGFSLFIMDRASDFACDWWSSTCAELSKVMLFSYSLIFIYVGVHVYLLTSSRGRVEALVAGGELWKEMVRLMSVYADLLGKFSGRVASGDLKGAAEQFQGKKEETDSATSKKTD